MSEARGLSQPHKLEETHVLDGFDCGKDVLNDWLLNHALANQRSGYTRVMVVAKGADVVGFYGLAMSSVQRGNAPRRIRTHPAPREIPCLLLGQLAVDRRWHGCGIGMGLLKDALIRATVIANDVGTRAVVVNALDKEAGRFWTKMGFTAALNDPQTYFKSVHDIQVSLAAAIAASASC